MLVFQREAQCPGIHQFVLRNRIPFQLLSAGCHLFDINIFRSLVSRLDHQFAFRIELLVQPDRHLVEGRRGQDIIQVTGTGRINPIIEKIAQVDIVPVSSLPGSPFGAL